MAAVITSIPPFTTERVIDDTDYAESYRDACLNSWLTFADEVISVNSKVEHEGISEAVPSVNVIPVTSDGTQFSGKPLVLLHDLIESALATNHEVFAFTNADIFFSRPSDLSDLARGITSGEAIVSRRFNVNSLRTQEGETYRWGYDLFIVHRSDLKKLSSNSSLFFGEPWWDYHALYNLILSGVNIRVADSTHALHLLHKDAFTWERWTEIGRDTLTELFQRIGKGNYDKASINAKALAGLVKKLERDTYKCGQPIYRHYLRMALRKSPDYIDKPYLHKFARILTSFAESDLRFEEASRDNIINACAELSAAMASFQI